jgi:tRNA-uridine 2-sulfurtransferase
VKERVIVAMSGGVDSSVAAGLLLEQGFDVVGVTLHLWDYPEDGGAKGRCCAPEDIHDARRVADHLGFPHYAFDRRSLFEKEVVGPFVEDYLAGRTPSPCVRCNRGVKVKELVGLADRLGAARIATGHYARTRRHAEGHVELLRGVDLNKDQSYFLHMLGDETLSRFVFPLGELNKPIVRDLAHKWGLPGAGKGESQELCFVPTGHYDELVQLRAGDRVRPGRIVGPDGKVLGEHTGLHKFTRGQRKNLGVATGERAYVVNVDVASGDVQLGSREELLTQSLSLSEVTVRSGYALPLEASVSIRYQGAPSRAQIKSAPTPEGSVERGPFAEILFAEPVAAPGAGQYAVFFDGEVVVGGGIIGRVPKPAAA